jgi:hypothetical protein
MELINSKTMKRSCVLLLLLSIHFGCNKTSDPVPLKVYLAGYAFNSNRIQVATYWENETAYSLTNGAANTGATSVAVNGNDVYVGGWDNSLPLGNNGIYWKNKVEDNPGIYGPVVAVVPSGTDIYTLGLSYTGWNYWKNGSATSISDTTSSFHVTGMAVNGSDVFISGYSAPIYSTRENAQYWKNGTLAFREPNQSQAAGIFVAGTDIYLVGYLKGSDPQHNTACYWKNGTLVPLTDGTTNAKANSIFVSGTDVYVAGFQNNYALYWKNGTATNLTDGTQPAGAMSIAVKGTSIYVGGYEGSHPSYWINGSKQNISQQNLDGAIVAVAVP